MSILGDSNKLRRYQLRVLSLYRGNVPSVWFVHLQTAFVTVTNHKIVTPVNCKSLRFVQHFTFTSFGSNIVEERPIITENLHAMCLWIRHKDLVSVLNGKRWLTI